MPPEWNERMESEMILLARKRDLERRLKLSEEQELYWYRKRLEWSGAIKVDDDESFRAYCQRFQKREGE